MAIKLQRWVVPAAVIFGLTASAAGFAACSHHGEWGEREEEEDEEAVGGCGVERWDVKTGTDTDVSRVNLTPNDTTVTQLVHLTAPATKPADGRVSPTETQAFRLRNVKLTEFKLESDSDVHLIVTDGSSTMNVELAAPSCVGTSSRFAAAISKVRSTFEAHHKPTSSFTTVNETISLVGVGFFDILHGQTGGAPNGAELHPVIDLCFGKDCLAATPTPPDAGTDAGTPGLPPIKNVFVIVMENHNWSSIKGSPSAPFINGTLLPMAAHAEQYVNVPGIHPSEPNYIWLEAGDNLGITTDSLPATNHQATTSHLVTLLESAGVSWKAYAEGVGGTICPVRNTGLYAPKHVPFVFFDDVINDTARCVAHVRPYAELATDIANDTVPRYAFITPNLCDDMHNSTGCATTDSIANGDTWLKTEVPKILASNAYKNGGAIFITFDESEGGDVPIGMIAVSPFAKPGYSNSIRYDHSSTLRTVQEIFGVTPLLRAAANATDLSDLFISSGGGADAGTDAGPACAHDKCTSGGKLNPTCDPCVQSVCDSDAFCCNVSWDSQCVREARTICGQCN